MKITRIDKKANSTKDCLNVLNNYKKSDWKRKSKFNLSDKEEARIFSDGEEFVTLINKERYVLFCKDLDLSQHKPLIDKINKLANNYYTHDYGDVWFNPETLTVWVSGGDGGIFYSTKSKTQIKKLLEENDYYFLVNETDTPYFHESITELKDSTFEAEYSPEEYSEEDEENDDNEKNYIQIGYINTL